MPALVMASPRAVGELRKSRVLALFLKTHMHRLKKLAGSVGRAAKIDEGVVIVASASPDPFTSQGPGIVLDH